MSASIIVKFGGNLDDLKKALAEGKVIIQSSSSSMEQMTAKWASHSAKLQVDAKNIVGALKNVGAATLTVGDAGRALKTLETAMSQLRATSQPVPPLMAQTAVELQKVATASKAVNTHAAGTSSALGGLMGTLMRFAGPAALGYAVRQTLT